MAAKRSGVSGVWLEVLNEQGKRETSAPESMRNLLLDKGSLMKRRLEEASGGC